MYLRSQGGKLRRRLEEPRRFIQVVAGPRQTGKTTLVRQVQDGLDAPGHYASADEPALRDRVWLEQQWEVGRLRARDSGAAGAVLVLDEIQKIADWSETVKRLWDEDTAGRVRLKVVLLGSAPLLIHRGLTESLAGRFELIHCTHWSYPEMRAAFSWSVYQYLYYGGYPGAAQLVAEPERWAAYVKDALIETTLSRDILLLSRVDKPALLRRLFQLACLYSGQVLSYQKMTGQLQDAGNTTTLAHYLDLLTGAGMVIGLQKYAGEAVRQRASSPKLQVLNTALMSAQSGIALDAARRDPEFWGRLTESAVGAHLVNGAWGTGTSVHYWLDRNQEVDFVLHSGRGLAAIEVKTGRRREYAPGLAAFAKAFRCKRMLLVGPGGIGVEEFLSRPVVDWMA
jgi:predicted AAA+ superfamily ATPase